MRALGHNPAIPDPYFTTPSVVQGGLVGDLELLAGTHLRVGASYDRDDVGDDLNHIVQLLISEVRFPSPISANAVHEYAVQRQYSYGSYLGAYFAHFGNDCTEQSTRIKAGIADGWKPDASPVYGAVRWYHRSCTGANPGLALLYEPIIAHYIR